jgi:hypothetical protein
MLLRRGYLAVHGTGLGSSPLPLMLGKQSAMPEPGEQAGRIAEIYRGSYLWIELSI